MVCGIYLIIRKSTGQMYIGQSVDIYKRFYKHSLGSEPTSRIDNAMKKYGMDEFELKILKCCKPRYLNRFEKLYIKKYNTFNDNFHYNLTIGGDGVGSGEDNTAWIDLDDEQIYHEYHEDGLSFSKIGQKRGVNSEVIKRHIQYYAKANNLPFIERNMYSYAVKDYPRIIKTGTDERGNIRYGLIHKNECLKESIFYEKLNGYLQDECRLEELYEEYCNRKEKKEKDLERILKQNDYIESNRIKYYRVWKNKHKYSRTGFYWAYTLKINGKKKTISSIDIKELKRKVIANGWVWKEITDENKKPKLPKRKKTPEEISIEVAKRKTTTGIYRVKCHKNRIEVSTGVLWEYSFIEDEKKRSISNIDLNYLKQRVLSENLPWIILDKNKAKQSFDFNDSLDISKANIRKEYTLWDKSKLKYRKSIFKKYGPNNPTLCFRLKFNKKEVPCGSFYDFLTPELMYDLIEDFSN